MKIVKKGQVEEITDVSMINTPSGRISKKDKKEKKRKILTFYGKLLEGTDRVWREKLEKVYDTEVFCSCGTKILRDRSGPPWVCPSCGDIHNIR